MTNLHAYKRSDFAPSLAIGIRWNLTTYHVALVVHVGRHAYGIGIKK